MKKTSLGAGSVNTDDAPLRTSAASSFQKRNGSQQPGMTSGSPVPSDKAAQDVMPMLEHIPAVHISPVRDAPVHSVPDHKRSHSTFSAVSVGPSGEYEEDELDPEWLALLVEVDKLLSSKSRAKIQGAR